MAYDRAKFFWGAIDIIHSDESPYSQAQTHAMGADALPPGIGVRRAQLVFSRATQVPAQDAVTTHLDFLNLTNGSPDDTWTDADFVELETLLLAYVQGLAATIPVSVVFDQIRWYRVGPGVLPPNPAVRIFEANFAGSAANSLPPQIAASVTLKTVPRRQWGRMYLPLMGQSALSPTGRFSNSAIDGVGLLTRTLFDGAVGVEKPPVVYSPRRGKAYTVETVQIDNVPDVIRSRRFNEKTYASIIP